MTFEEPGRTVRADGRVHYEWPPRGRFAEMWERLVTAFPDEVERDEALRLLLSWRDSVAVLVAFTEDGEVRNVEWPWP